MTTAPEVKKWLRPVLKQHPDLVLVGRNLIIPPVHHILRGIFFDASWDKQLCRPIWYAGAMFMCNSESDSPPFDIHEQYSLQRSNEENFPSHVMVKTQEVLQFDFSRVYTVEQYINFGKNAEVETDGRDSRIIPHRPFHYAVALSALSDLDAAEQKVVAAAAWWERGAIAAARQAEEWRAKGAVAIARDTERTAISDGVMARHLGALRDLVQRRDRAGIGDLLRSWEFDRAKALKIDHLWEPTAFPVEMS